MPDIERDRRRWLVRDAFSGPCGVCGYRLRWHRRRGGADRTIFLEPRNPSAISFDVSREWRLHSPQEIVTELRKFDRLCNVCKKRRELTRA